MVKRHYEIRNQRYKFIHFYYDIDIWEFFDLREDPMEMHNLIKYPAYKDEIERMTADLFQLQEENGDPILQFLAEEEFPEEVFD